MPTSQAPRRRVDPPAHLSEAARAIWRAWAPLARQAGTLRAATRPSFALLCDLEERRRRLHDPALLDHFNGATLASLLRSDVLNTRHLVALLQAFGLAPVGAAPTPEP